LQLREHIIRSDGIETKITVHPAAIDARVQGADAFLDNAVTVVPRREPVGLAGAENGDHRFACCGSQVRWKGIMTQHGIGTLQGGRERGKIGGL
jgi:hypothetical protein